MASGFFQTVLPAIFRQRGASLAAIGLFTLTYLPFGLSFMWAPLVDRYYFRRLGRRRSWMLSGQLLSGVALLMAATSSPETSPIATVSVFGLLCLTAATVDVAIVWISRGKLPRPRARLGQWSADWRYAYRQCLWRRWLVDCV